MQHLMAVGLAVNNLGATSSEVMTVYFTSIYVDANQIEYIQLIFLSFGMLYLFEELHAASGLSSLVVKFSALFALLEESAEKVM